MPIYEYQCEACGQVEEVIQRFSDKPLSTCKHCSGKLHKLISQSAFHLKGSGWYVTDYAKNSPPQKKSESKPAADSTSSGEKSTSAADSAD